MGKSHTVSQTDMIKEETETVALKERTVKREGGEDGAVHHDKNCI